MFAVYRTGFACIQESCEDNRFIIDFEHSCLPARHTSSIPYCESQPTNAALALAIQLTTWSSMWKQQDTVLPRYLKLSPDCDLVQPITLIQGSVDYLVPEGVGWGSTSVFLVLMVRPSRASAWCLGLKNRPSVLGLRQTNTIYVARAGSNLAAPPGCRETIAMTTRPCQ